MKARENVFSFRPVLVISEINPRNALRGSFQQRTDTAKRFILTVDFDQDIFQKSRVGHGVLFVSALREKIVDKIYILFAQCFAKLIQFIARDISSWGALNFKTLVIFSVQKPLRKIRAKPPLLVSSKVN
jgi:hypothetical protein